jgi:replicative DNA helicase
VTTLTQPEGLPASIHTEVTILGAMLLDAEARNDAIAKLHPSDFSLDSHQRIYKAIVHLQPGVDLTTVRAELEKRRELETVGGPAYLFYLTEGIPHNFNIESYVQIVKDKSLLRQLVGICQDFAQRAADPSEDAIGILGDLEHSLSKVSDSTIQGGFSTIGEIVTTSFGSIDQLYEQGREISGLRTSFRDFDRMTSGLQPSELIIIAARPSMGKTAFATNIAQNAAVHDGKVVAIFSLEMSKESLLRRMLASEACVGARKLQTGTMRREDRHALTESLGRLVGAGIHIDDTPGIGLAEMRAKARRLMREFGLDLILVDYLQLMSGPKSENRTQEVGSISRGLKALAKELKVPVVALSQLSRQSEQRTGDKRPRLSDLRESGAIEQDADVVAFIHREEYYDRDNEDLKGRAEIIIAKQRNGPTGDFGLVWLADYTRFDNYAEER